MHQFSLFAIFLCLTGFAHASLPECDLGAMKKTYRGKALNLCFNRYKDSMSFEECTNDIINPYYWRETLSSHGYHNNDRSDRYKMCFNHFEMELNYDQCNKLTYGMKKPSERFWMAKKCLKLLKEKMSFSQCEQLASSILDPDRPKPLTRSSVIVPTKTICLFAGPACNTRRTTGWADTSRKSSNFRNSLIKKCNKYFYNN